jgi:hypothetical protein
MPTISDFDFSKRYFAMTEKRDALVRWIQAELETTPGDQVAQEKRRETILNYLEEIDSLDEQFRRAEFVQRSNAVPIATQLGAFIISRAYWIVPVAVTALLLIVLGVYLTWSAPPSVDVGQLLIGRALAAPLTAVGGREDWQLIIILVASGLAALFFIGVFCVWAMAGDPARRREAKQLLSQFLVFVTGMVSGFVLKSF